MIDQINNKLRSLSINHKPHLDNIFEHIYYEFEMFYHTAVLLKQILCEDKKTQSILENAVLESYRTHLRCIADFFGKNRKADDILVKDILIMYDENAFKCLSSGAREGINKSTTHITENRMKKSIELQANIFINSDFKKQAENITIFLSHLKKDNICEKYKDHYQEPDLIPRFEYLKRIYDVKS